MKKLRALIRPRITYANVVATLALLLALSGTAGATYAYIKSSDIIDESINYMDIKTGGVRSPEVYNGSLKGFDLAPNTIGGSRVLESTLSEVPKAAKVGNFSPSLIKVSLADTTGATTIFETTDFGIVADCNSGSPTFQATGITDDGRIDARIIGQDDATSSVRNPDFDMGESVNIRIVALDFGRTVLLSYAKNLEAGNSTFVQITDSVDVSGNCNFDGIAWTYVSP